MPLFSACPPDPALQHPFYVPKDVPVSVSAPPASQLTGMLVRELLKASHVFDAGDAQGGMAQDAFINAVADAVAHAQQFGGLEQRPLPARPGPPGAPTSLLAVTGGSGRISSDFGPRTDPINGHHGFHHGVDVAAARGTPIRALTSGLVTRAEEAGGYGLVVEVKNAVGEIVRYAHAESLDVRVGDQVHAGQTLGAVGSTGRSTGPHVHVEVLAKGHAVDPETALLLDRRR